MRIVGELESREEEALERGCEIGEKVVRPMLSELHEDMMQRLDAVTVEDLCRTAEQRGVANANAERLDFTI